MGTTRGDTRRRIQEVALELFADKGYDKTSLREIAERLDVTKAALYYHFKTKEDILVSLVEDHFGRVDALIAWGRDQPATLETRLELLARYSALLAGGSTLFRFMQENQASIRELSLGESFKARMGDIIGMLRDKDADLKDQARCISAIFAMHAGMFALADAPGDAEEKRLACLEVAQDLVTAAHKG